ncbi:MAG TPA: HDOD domain-containing protein [Clostridiales bacterium]|nr:HDOD domain-containing protein [Clostridiales bacterium]HQP70707.1 HDOD domain-containing protein [Clostridiales bacterium]
MNESITLGQIEKLINGMPDYPREINEISRIIRSDVSVIERTAQYILNNKVFYDVFSNFNPDLSESLDKTAKLTEVVSRLDPTSLRNILFTCSVISLQTNDVSKMFVKKIVMSSYICRDIIEKVNFYRKSGHNAENFFLYALFHDIGELFTAIHFPKEVAGEIYKDKDHTDLSNINNITAHNEIGYMLAKKWRLPSIFSYICLNHNKLEYRKFTADFIYIINSIAVSDAVALELLDFEIPYTNTWDVGHSIYKIGLREEDIYTEAGVIGQAEKKIAKILTLFNLN